MNRTQLHVALINDWVLNPEQKKYCDSYYVLYWDKGHFYSTINARGSIVHNGVEYIPVYKGSITADNIDRVRLSFRQANEVADIPAYVLIKPAPPAPARIIQTTETNERNYYASS